MSLAGPPVCQLLSLSDHLIDFDVAVTSLRFMVTDISDDAVDVFEPRRGRLEDVLVDVEEAASIAPHRAVHGRLLTLLDLNHLGVVSSVRAVALVGMLLEPLAAGLG